MWIVPLREDFLVRLKRALAERRGYPPYRVKLTTFQKFDSANAVIANSKQ
jgi:hypothetical protein